MSPHLTAETDRAIRASGLRRTVPRAVVAHILHTHPGHLTVGQIQAHIADELPEASGMARSSVYRALEALEGAGLVVALRSGQEEARFEWDGAHHHLICDDCGHVAEVSLQAAASLEQEAQQAHGFHARVRHLALRGTCAPCREA
ncbi:MAG: transcriptional repressor [Dehalococcoidia bacterium]|nr:transcriptional repressor [Dehalococcoidia bacterium]